VAEAAAVFGIEQRLAFLVDVAALGANRLVDAVVVAGTLAGRSLSTSTLEPRLEHALP
jgi:hypothetical protein